MPKLFFSVSSIFIVFGFPFFTFQQKLLESSLGTFISNLHNFLFGKELLLLDFSSDTRALYLFLAVLLAVSLLFSAVISLIKVNDKKVEKLYTFSTILSLLFLSTVYLYYGFDKIFKQQFYLPEPNILHTQFGNLTQDIAFWSLIGSNYGLSVIMGVTEVLIAISLWFSRSRIIGLLGCLCMSLLIFIINIQFNISVKLLSIILCGLSFLLLFSYKSALIKMYKQAQISESIDLKKNVGIIKIVLLVAIVFCIISPNIFSGNYNDDNAQRPFLHGSYINLEPQKSRIKKIYFHRKNYLIFEDTNHNMTDFYIQIDSLQNNIQLTDYENNTKKIPYIYSQKDSIIFLQLNSKETLGFKKTEYYQKPLLQNEFSWFVDDL